MVGENLRDGYWEVAFEQWTEREYLVGFNVILTLPRGSIGRDSRTDRVQRVIFEFRWYHG